MKELTPEDIQKLQAFEEIAEHMAHFCDRCGRAIIKDAPERNHIKLPKQGWILCLRCVQIRNFDVGNPVLS